jgi:hypothetical protein
MCLISLHFATAITSIEKTEKLSFASIDSVFQMNLTLYRQHKVHYGLVNPALNHPINIFDDLAASQSRKARNFSCSDGANPCSEMLPLGLTFILPESFVTMQSTDPLIPIRPSSNSRHS